LRPDDVWFDNNLERQETIGVEKPLQTAGLVTNRPLYVLEVVPNGGWDVRSTPGIAHDEYFVIYVQITTNATQKMHVPDRGHARNKNRKFHLIFS
jgi:hypothetical protein